MQSRTESELVLSTDMKQWLRTVSVVILLTFTSLPRVVDAETIVTYSLFARGSNGTAISSAAVGDDFVIDVFARDARASATGVFSAYTDLRWNEGLAIALGQVGVGADFPNGRTDWSVSSGLLDETGGVGGLLAPNLGDQLLYSMPFRATESGELEVRLDAADAIHHETSLYGLDRAARPSECVYGNLHLTIVPEPTSAYMFLMSGLLMHFLRFRERIAAS